MINLCQNYANDAIIANRLYCCIINSRKSSDTAFLVFGTSRKSWIRGKVAIN